jgi:hypothetical protein
MKTAGVVIDFYDDPSGSVLKSIFSDPDALPGQVKTGMFFVMKHMLL